MTESPIITFVRGATLLVVLIALPGIAVCWNHLPKDLWSKTASNSVTPEVEKTQFFPRDSGESTRSVSVFAPESFYPTLPETPVLSEMPLASVASQNPPIQNHWAPHNTAIQQVSWEHPRTESQPDFESLEIRLKALGATYYKLEKWGNRGELFRFSCFVALADNHLHTKHFQTIGSDVVTVMQTVITDIERWKNAQ